MVLCLTSQIFNYNAWIFEIKTFVKLVENVSTERSVFFSGGDSREEEIDAYPLFGIEDEHYPTVVCTIHHVVYI